MGQFICNGEKYKYGKGYIYLPVKIENLPESINIDGYYLQVKPEFHCSLVCIKDMPPEYGDNLEEKITEYFCDFVSKNEISFIKYKDEFRLVKKDEKVSVIVMCEISNLKEFFNVLEKEYNIKAEIQPTHVTIYTLQLNIGIGITSQTDLVKLTTLVDVSDEIKTCLKAR